MADETDPGWRKLSEEVLRGMKEWRRRRVRIEVAHHYHHLRGIGILFFQGLLHEEPSVLLRAVPSDLQKAFASEWLSEAARDVPGRKAQMKPRHIPVCSPLLLLNTFNRQSLTCCDWLV